MCVPTRRGQIRESQGGGAEVYSNVLRRRAVSMTDKANGPAPSPLVVGVGGEIPGRCIALKNSRDDECRQGSSPERWQGARDGMKRPTSAGSSKLAPMLAGSKPKEVGHGKAYHKSGGG